MWTWQTLILHCASPKAVKASGSAASLTSTMETRNHHPISVPRQDLGTVRTVMGTLWKEALSATATHSIANLATLQVLEWHLRRDPGNLLFFKKGTPFCTLHNAILYITQLHHMPKKTAPSYDLGSAIQTLLKQPALTSALPISHVSSAFFPMLRGKQQEQPV